MARTPGGLREAHAPWDTVRVVERTGGIENGGRVVLAVRAGGFSHRWVAEHQDYLPGRQFCDRQIDGPFAQWLHCHRLLPCGPTSCVLEDDIEYALPLAFVGKGLAGRFVRRKLERMFRYRHRVTAADLALHGKYVGDQSMKILISGSSGLVGSALVPFPTTGGHRILRLARAPSGSENEETVWDTRDLTRLEGLDAVVHLAGENIAARRWSTVQKARIRNSRVQGTRQLCETLSRRQHRPRVLVTASAIGYYGDRGDSWLTETSSSGNGFLADVCREWEAATEPAVAAGIRVVNLRFGIILSPRGGAMAQMLMPFRLGLGGRIDSGRQWMSWIAIDDAIGVIHHALVTDTLHGPVNAVAPNPVTNRDFTKTLGKVLGRPTLFPIPAFMARMSFGEMANELLLASTRVEPRALIDASYRFLYGDLGDALRHLLGKDHPRPAGNELVHISASPNQAVEARS